MFGLDSLSWRTAIYAPLFAVWIIGIIISLATWRKHPQVSLLAFVGFVIQVFLTGAGNLFFYLFSTQFQTFGWSAQEWGIVFNIFVFVQVCLNTVAWVLILLAIFRWRSQSGRILGHDGQYLPEGFATGPTEGVY